MRGAATLDARGADPLQIHNPQARPRIKRTGAGSREPEVDNAPRDTEAWMCVPLVAPVTPGGGARGRE